MDKMMRTALDVNGRLNIRLQQTPGENNTWVGYIEDPRRSNDDDIGALYYVVAVIFIYGLSIVMMIASHIRKNKQDNQLRTYLKEMAKLRKDDRREKVLSKMTDLAKRRQMQEEQEAAKQRLQDKVKDCQAVDSEAESEICQPLMKKDVNDDNTDSVFLPPDYCISPSQPKRPEVGVDRQSESSSYRNTSVSSRGSVRNNSTSSYAFSYVPSDSLSPSLSDSRHNSDRPVKGRVRSPTFHDYRRWKWGEARPSSVQDYRAVRIQERPSPSASEHKSILSPSGSRSPSLNEFRMSPLCGRTRSLTVHEARPAKGIKATTTTISTTTANDVRFHRTLEPKQPAKVNELKLSLPASFHVVDEDAVL